ncbi:hypothetical protein D3C71_1476150 [compost metagenome]
MVVGVAVDVVGIRADGLELRRRRIDHEDIREVDVQLLHLARHADQVALIGGRHQRFGSRRARLLQDGAEVLLALRVFLEQHHLHAVLDGLFAAAFGQPRRERFVGVQQRHLLHALVGGQLHVGAQHGGHGHLGAGHHVLEALFVQVVAGGGPDHHVLAQPLRDGGGRGRQRGTEGRKHQIHFFIDNQAFVDTRDHLLVAAVVQLDQFDGVLLALDVDAAAAIDVVHPQLHAPHAGLRCEGEAAGRRNRHAHADLVRVLGGACSGSQGGDGHGQRR